MFTDYLGKSLTHTPGIEYYPSHLHYSGHLCWFHLANRTAYSVSASRHRRLPYTLPIPSKLPKYHSLLAIYNTISKP